MSAAEPRRARGRPRAYDAETALTQARDVFWRAGYSGSSLDDLGAATGMNRPSLYGAFGPKSDLYLKTLARYRDNGRVAIESELGGGRSLRDGLMKVYASALDTYFPIGVSPARGCFLIGTAATEAMSNPDVRAMLGGALRVFDDAFEARIVRARREGELPRGADPKMLAKLASAVLHTLAVRSRAGDSRRELEKTAAAGADLICGVK